MSRNAETQTPDWSKNNGAYFAGSLEITSNDTFAAVKGKGAPPKGILVQTDLNLPRIQFQESNLEAALNAVGGFELIDKTGNPNFSYIWLAASSAVNPDTNTSIWSVGFSHITLVRDAPRNTGAPAHLIDSTRGTHLTLRATMNGVKKPFGMHISLPADSASMAQHFLVIVPTNVADTIAAKQFWVDLTNIFTKHCKCKADFAKASWKKFLEDLKTDVVNILTEYAKVLKKLEETGQKMN